MATASSIQRKVDAALVKVTPTGRVIYKRVVTTIGDSLIGRTTSSFVDTLLNPQPSIVQAGREHLSGARDAVETVISKNGNRLVKDDYILTISSSAVSEDELQDKNLFFVFKDGVNEEVLFIMDYSPIEYQGSVIVHEIYARSVKTP